VEYTFSHAEMDAYERCWDNVRTDVANAIEFSENGKAEGIIKNQLPKTL
jgi:hypothetical protein